MKKRKTPWGIIVVMVGLISAIAYTKMADVAPAVGTVEEMQAREEARMKAKTEEMMKEQPNALGKKRDAPSASTVASVVRDTQSQDLNAIKHKKVGKSPVAMIMYPQTKVTQDRPNESQPFNSWYLKDSGRNKLGK